MSADLSIPKEIISSLEAHRNEELSKADVLSRHPDLSEEEFDAYWDTFQQSMNAIELSSIRTELKDIHSELYGDQAKEPNKVRVWLMAAAIVLIGTFAFLLVRSNQGIVTFDELFEPYPDLVSMRGDEETNMNKAMRLYSLGKFDKALNAFDVFSPDSLFNEYYFYRGISALGIGRMEDAKRAFLSIGTNPNNPYWQQTRWYLALAHWKLDETGVAINLLTSIKQGDYKFEDTQKLLDQLKD